MQPEPATQGQTELFVGDRIELSDSLPDIALQQSEPSRPSQSQPPEPASEQQADRTPPEQLDLASAETQAQSALQPQFVAPQRSDRDRPSPTDESDRIPPESAASEQSDCDRADTVLQPVYDPYATPPERDYVSPGQPPQKPGNRIVKIDTAEDLFHEIRWCLSNSGHFVLIRSFVSPQKIGYFLEHRAYNDGERQVKTALAKELIKRDAIRSDDPAKGSGSGRREFYIWNDRDFAPRNSDRTPPEQLDSATAETHAQQEFQPQQSDSPSDDRHLIATEDQSDRPEPTAPAQSDRDRTNTVLQPKSDKPKGIQPKPKIGIGSGMVTKNYVEPGEESKFGGNRIVEIETADALLAEIRWCLNHDGDFVFMFDRGKSGNGTPRRMYYLRHEYYWEGMRPVKTALVRELIDRRAIWTNDPAKGPGSGCRRFYPTTTSPEQPDLASAETQVQSVLQPPSAGVLQQSDKPAPEFPEWMTARQAFESLGGDPSNRDSSVRSADGSKQIKFSTFKKKTSSELKPFGLELSQDQKRRRLPCYRLLKPSDEDILRLIGDLDQRLRTDNYLPIFHLREKLKPLLSRKELDEALYRLSKNNRIELSALQEVTAYTPEQIDAGIPQNVGGRLFFIIRVDSCR